MYTQRKPNATAQKTLKCLFNNLQCICSTALQETIVKRKNLKHKIFVRENLVCTANMEGQYYYCATFAKASVCAKSSGLEPDDNINH